MPLLVPNDFKRRMSRKKIVDAIGEWFNNVLCIVMWWSIMRDKLLMLYYSRHILSRGYVMNFTARRDFIYNLVYASDIVCVDQLWLDRKAFMKLCELLKNEGGLRDTRHMLVDEQVSLFLHTLAHHTKNRVVRHYFGRSGETVSRYFNIVLCAVIWLHGHFLKKPFLVRNDSTDRRWKWFENCLGALDGTYIPVRAPANERAAYRTRKGGIAVNMLGVVNPDMQFIYVLTGWEGSAADGRVLRDAVSRPHGLKVPEGYYYLCDVGYTNGEGFLAPYRGQRYHLNEWENPQTPAQEFFNMQHSSVRNTVERAFGLLKIRWAVLRSSTWYPIRIQNRIIMACCLLHNYIRSEMSIDPFEDVAQTEFGDESIGDDPVILTIVPSNEWTQFRDNLANTMWNEWRARTN